MAARPHMIDAHSHIDDEQFAADVDEVIGRADEAGVTRMLVVGYDHETWISSRKLVAAHPDKLYSVIGIHPNSAFETSEDSLAELAALCRGEDGGPRAVGLGETGLDYYWD